MKRFFFSILVVIGFAAQLCASSDIIADKVAEILVAKVNADKETALEAVKNSPKITIDGDIFNKVTIGEDVILVGNAGIFLLGDIEVGSITNIVELRKNSVVIGNVGVAVGGG